jgi:CheY-like chemotaxis protein
LYFFGVLIEVVRHHWAVYRRAAKGSIQQIQAKSVMVAFSVGYLAFFDYFAAWCIPLDPLGHKVLTAGKPGEALRQAKAHIAEIQLLITDVVMPEVYGRDLAKAIDDIKPGLKCLFTSGYTADVIAHRGIGQKRALPSQTLLYEGYGVKSARGVGRE